jgi:hypothetical protein
MSSVYEIHCQCGEVHLRMEGEPRVRGFCHCEDCRELLNVPFHSVTVWNREQVTVISGDLVEYQHPRLNMKRAYCRNCGETLYNTNAADWRVISQLLIRKCMGGMLPDALQSRSHFFYGRRIVNVEDTLPKKE